MAAGGPEPISIREALAWLTFLPDRSPTTAAGEAGDAFARLSGYRDGGIFVGHWAGTSEWERHPADEIVLVLGGGTTVFFLVGGDEQPATLRAGELVVVPGGTWHRFETPERVELLSVTPQPTEHTPDRPS